MVIKERIRTIHLILRSSNINILQRFLYPFVPVQRDSKAFPLLALAPIALSPAIQGKHVSFSTQLFHNGSLLRRLEFSAAFIMVSTGH